jgi:hypothetical protein
MHCSTTGFQMRLVPMVLEGKLDEAIEQLGIG